MSKIYDSINVDNYNKRLTNRRNGIFNNTHKIKDKSTLYCNICNIPDTLTMCSICKNNLCTDCYNGKNICIHCEKTIKVRISIENGNIEIPKYNKIRFLSKIFCCLK